MSRASEKNLAVVERLKSMDRVLVAIFGGVDSTFLVAAAKAALGPDVPASLSRSDSQL